MNVIEFQRVSKRYHKKDFLLGKSDVFWGIKDVSFFIKKGETVSLIGRNGAGKSTILKLISKITYPTEGNICVQGQVVPLMRMDACLNPLLDVRENAFLLMSIFCIPRKERREIFQKILCFSGLKDFQNTPFRKLSSGMQARLAFSIAIYVPSDIILIDEVLAVGDQDFQEKCLEKIMQFKKRGKTLLFVSHNIQDIKRVSDRIIWLDKGKVRKEGSLEVMEEYLKTF